MLHTQLVVHDLQNNILVHKDRDLNYRFMLAEWLWIQAGRQDVASIARFNSKIADYSDNGDYFAGAYGPRLWPQWNYLLETLKKDRDSRQAVATIFTPCPGPTKDVPCTLSLQVFIRHDRLHGIMTMRSNDLWLGLPHDFFNFAQMTNWLAGQLEVGLGSMAVQAGSSHIYARNFEAVDRVLAFPHAGYTVRSPALPKNFRADLVWSVANNEDPASLLTKEEEKDYVGILCLPTKAKALSALKGLSY